MTHVPTCRQLRSFDATGGPGARGWGWGCSHSMEVRIVHNGTTLGPVCASDCFPNKGVHFNHRTFLYPDETGSNCGGRYGTTLGGVVPFSDGFWVAFTAIDARMSDDVALIHVDNSRTVGEPVWLTTDSVDDANFNAARFGDDLLVAYSAGTGGDVFVRASGATGAPLAAPEAVPGANLRGATDFFVFANGDVGWVTSTGSTLALARLRACD